VGGPKRRNPRYPAPVSDGPIALVMAAGHGTRMHSSLPKVMHPVCGRPMLEWVVEAARAGGAERVVCVVRPEDGVAERLPEGVEWVEQREGEGTAAAVRAAREAIPQDATVVVLSGDHPLISPELIRELLAAHERDGAAATLLTTEELDPARYGRIVRAPDRSVERIVETKNPAERTPDELAIREINVGTYVFAAGPLFEVLEEVEEERGERFLTAVFPILSKRGERVITHPTDDATTALGVNTRADLLEIERRARDRIVEAHAVAGVTFVSPESVSIDAGVEIGPDTTVEAGVTLRGETRVGAGCSLGPQTTVIDSSLGDRVTAPHSYLVGSEVHDDVSVGPFAYLRPGAVVEERAKIGTFVEVKNSRVGAGAKVPHLSYIGDADVGDEANVAAGNITANYDGRRKHRTVIGKRAKTGVNNSFVAPVRVGEGAYTGAGSVITEDVPDGALGISRPEQENVEGYADRVEKESRE
jgi:bifunctional UDP-N-acetylglucosamine pyrophosphorylase/glucosamine-1-phosphate N-acetyltransferase